MTEEYISDKLKGFGLAGFLHFCLYIIITIGSLYPTF